MFGLIRLGKISPFGLLFKGPGNFWGTVVAKKSGNVLGYICLKHFFTFSHQQFQSMICCRYLYFEIELYCRCIGIFCLCDCFGYFFQILGNIFFSIIWSPWFCLLFRSFRLIALIYLVQLILFLQFFKEDENEESLSPSHRDLFSQRSLSG